jgi:drug/metabolite transporter (DMT)-like permease
MTEGNAWRRLEPVLLLFAAGFCIGLFFPLGKLAGQSGIPPLLYACVTAAGASIVLAAIVLIAGERPTIDGTTLRYAAIAGQLTFAVPFGTLFFVIPHHLGSGIPAIFQSLTPIVTLAIVYMIGFERPNLVRTMGLASGLAGALIILLSRNADQLQVAAPAGWYLAALITPVALAAGNVFRTTSWPRGQGPLPLAMLTLAAAACGIFLLLALAELTAHGGAIVEPLKAGWRLMLLQSLATGIGYAFFFRLQQVGGPVYLSQISYLNTAVGLAFAVLLFSERLNPWIWLAVALVFAGVALVNRTYAPPAGGSPGAAKPDSY